MKSDLDTTFILKCVKEVGDSFLPDFRKNKIPGTFEDLLPIFRQIESKCLTSLKAKLSTRYQGTPWAEDELDFDAQKEPMKVPEYWICDSMDGAVQFIQHIPGWTINLVLVRDQQPFFSAVYDPLHGEMFWAQVGEGAYLNDKKIQISPKKDSNFMLTSFSHPPFSTKVSGLNSRISSSVERLLNRYGFIRNYGPTSLQMAYVACGRLDVFCEEGLDTFNWLPGILIAKEAGADILTTVGHTWKWGDDSVFVSAPTLIEIYNEV